MFKIIIYLIITIGILHFTLYYFNFDFNFENFNYFKKSEIETNSGHMNINIRTNSTKVIDFISKQSLIDSINELKTLNECINNGEINTFFS
jgi:hypothetical protein